MHSDRVRVHTESTQKIQELLAWNPFPLQICEVFGYGDIESQRGELPVEKSLITPAGQGLRQLVSRANVQTPVGG